MLSTFTGSFGFGRRNREPDSSGGSVDIPGTSGSFLRVTNDAAFAPGTGDFTIEWWQYADAYPSFPRIMSIGTYATDPMLAISLEGIDSDRTMNVWCGPGGGLGVANVGVTLNQWVHFALVRASGVLKIYKNGVNISGSGTINTNDVIYEPSDYFAIGTETSNGTSSFGNSSFNGRLTGFHYIVGLALYTSDFTVPSVPALPIPETVLLLNFTNFLNFLTDESTPQKTVTTVGLATWNFNSPY
jgi:hypothetical protein